MFISKSKKSPFYQLTYEVDGKRTTISTKTKNLQDAYKFMSEFYFQNQNPQIKENRLILLSKFRDEYLEFVESSKSKSYIKSIKLSFKMMIEYTGDVPLCNIDSRTIDKFITTTFSRTQKGASLYYRSLKAAFSKAVTWNYISENVFKKAKVPKIARTFPVFITEDELQLILTNTPVDFLKDLFTVGFYTGLRQGELVNMRWSWIDFNQNQIVVKCSNDFNTKSRKERIVPMSEKVRRIVMNRSNNCDESNDNFVFYNTRGMKLKEDYVCKHFKKAVRISELNESIHFHTLRHSFASKLVQKGVSLYIVKELLGHEDLVTTQIYSHLQKQNLWEAINII